MKWHIFEHILVDSTKFDMFEPGNDIFEKFFSFEIKIIEKNYKISWFEIFLNLPSPEMNKFEKFKHFRKTLKIIKFTINVNIFGEISYIF